MVSEICENAMNKIGQIKEDVMNVCSEELQSILPNKNESANTEAVQMGLLPSLSLDGLKDTLGKGKEIAVDVGKKVGDFTVESAKTIANIPKENWLELAKSGKEVAEKNGSTLALDAALVVGTEGTNIMSDAKLVYDLYKTATSPEGKELGHDIVEAWKAGEKAKQAKQVA